MQNTRNCTNGALCNFAPYISQNPSASHIKDCQGLAQHETDATQFDFSLASGMCINFDQSLVICMATSPFFFSSSTIYTVLQKCIQRQFTSSCRSWVAIYMRIGIIAGASFFFRSQTHDKKK